MKKLLFVSQNRILLVAVFFVCGWGTSVCLGQSVPNANNPGTPWPATDALGRSVRTATNVSPLRPDRFVGIFYFLWHGDVAKKSPHWDGPYDIQKIMTRDPEALDKPDSPLWGSNGMAHYWDEPLYGYYRSVDEWVLRRHAYLLADAGLDVLIFDTTNVATFPDEYGALCKVFRQIRKEGGRTPQIAFMVHTKAGETAEKLYQDLYEPGEYSELWFRWQGKPLLICDPEEASEEVREFFTLRRAHWPFTMVDTAYAWHWEATYPQPIGYTDDRQQAEQVNVSVAQNLRRDNGEVTNMSEGHARGRSFHAGEYDRSPGAINHGHNFQEQWQRALEVDPPFVMVTGWNEWIAGRFRRKENPLVFVDQFDQEYSRDIEPMKHGGYGDNYYLQLVSNVREYKGAPELPVASAPVTISIDRGFEQWQDVEPTFGDHLGETIPRDADGVAGLHYTNHSGRNDFETLRVSRDEQHVYFYARARESISPSNGENWMWLLLDVDQNVETGWHGYDYIVNRAVENGSVTWLEKNQGGWAWEKVAKVEMRVEGEELHLAIPRKLLGLAIGGTQVSLDFKWVDHCQKPGEIMDFYLSGDVAPEGRFNYRYLGE